MSYIVIDYNRIIVCAVWGEVEVRWISDEVRCGEVRWGEVRSLCVMVRGVWGQVEVRWGGFVIMSCDVMWGEVIVCHCMWCVRWGGACNESIRIYYMYILVYYINYFISLCIIYYVVVKYPFSKALTIKEQLAKSMYNIGNRKRYENQCNSL